MLCVIKLIRGGLVQRYSNSSRLLVAPEPGMQNYGFWFVLGFAHYSISILFVDYLG